MGETRHIVAGSFIDGSGGEVRKDAGLTVQDGLITVIGSAADLFGNGKVPIDDLSHCTIVPALVDCSVSLSRSPSVDSAVRLAAEEAGLAEKTAMVERHIRYCHGYGVLGIADSDDPLGLLDGCRQGMVAGNIIDICTSGRIFRSQQDCASGDLQSGDFLKIAYSGNIEDGQNPEPQLAYDDLCRILKRRVNGKAVVLANGRQAVAEALAAGCDAIEQGYSMGEDNLAKMAAENVLWIPSVLRAKNGVDGASSGGDVACRFSTRYVAPGKADPKAETYWQKMLAEQLTQLRLARKLGVPTAVGTGAGSVGILHGESMVEEMKMFLKAGFSLAQTIRAASETGARFFGMEKLGALAVGRPATFLVTRGSPQQLPRKLAYLEGIYVDGLPSVAYH